MNAPAAKNTCCVLFAAARTSPQKFGRPGIDSRRRMLRIATTLARRVPPSAGALQTAQTRRGRVVEVASEEEEEPWPPLVALVTMDRTNGRVSIDLAFENAARTFAALVDRDFRAGWVRSVAVRALKDFPEFVIRRAYWENRRRIETWSTGSAQPGANYLHVAGPDVWGKDIGFATLERLDMDERRVYLEVWSGGGADEE